jgi:hypothetical protein
VGQSSPAELILSEEGRSPESVMDDGEGRTYTAIASLVHYQSCLQGLGRTLLRPSSSSPVRAGKNHLLRGDEPPSPRPPKGMGKPSSGAAAAPAFWYPSRPHSVSLPTGRSSPRLALAALSRALLERVSSPTSRSQVLTLKGTSASGWATSLSGACQSPARGGLEITPRGDTRRNGTVGRLETVLIT